MFAMKIRVYLWNTMLGKYSPSAVFNTFHEARDYAIQQMQKSHALPHAKLMEYDPRKDDITGKTIEKIDSAGLLVV